MKHTTLFFTLAAVVPATPAHAQIVHMRQTIFGMD